MRSPQIGIMICLKQRAARLTLGLGLAAALACGAVVPALADDVTGTAEVSGAASVVFSVPATLSMSAVSLDGTDKESTGSLAIGVTDYRGTGAGWKLQVSSTGFMRSGDTTPLAGFKISSSALADISTGASTAPTNTASTSAIPIGSSPATFYSAAADSGMGNFTITPTFVLPVPANTLQGSYTAAVTIDTSSAP